MSTDGTSIDITQITYEQAIVRESQELARRVGRLEQIISCTAFGDESNHWAHVALVAIEDACDATELAIRDMARIGAEGNSHATQS